MVGIDPTHPFVGATLRVVAAVIAALIVAVGFFDRTVPYALAVGLVVGALYAVVSYLGVRLTP